MPARTATATDYATMIRYDLIDAERRMLERAEKGVREGDVAKARGALKAYYRLDEFLLAARAAAGLPLYPPLAASLAKRITAIQDWILARERRERRSERRVRIVTAEAV